MSSPFDQIIDRRGSGDLKYSRPVLSALSGTELPDEIYPMWVADTDFAAPPHVLDAIRRRVDFGIFGYPTLSPAFSQSVCWWQKARFGWEADPDWVTPLPGVLAGLNIAIRALTKPEAGVIIQPPVYDHFFSVLKDTGRRTVLNPLLCRDGQYEMDLPGLERLLADPSNTMLILSSPHNPAGRVWREEELRRLGELCLAHGVILVSDEVHGDIVYRPHVHRPMLSLSSEFRNNFLMLSSPAKTFNLPGLKTAFAVIPNPALREKFQSLQATLSLQVENTLGLTALQAAYTPEGAVWTDRLVDYLEGNASLTSAFCAQSGLLSMSPLEGTFLAWLSVGGADDQELMRRCGERGVIPSRGSAYGPGGEGHLRLNIGCPRSRLTAALARMEEALSSLR